ncbi:glycosyltransferase family 4 protein [Edwardsiella tarda]|uniref:glycosyltransferase family 4 protein n=1 Tax=Edwardsiella TaxID=635 RepID=UPI00351C129C
MNVAFMHDHQFFIDEDGGIYSKGKVNKNMFDVYLAHVENITIVSRFKKIKKTMLDNSYCRVDSENISFIPFKNLSKPVELINWNKNFNEMCSIVKNFDFIICRLPSEIGLLAVSAAKLLNVKYAIEFVACPWDGLWNYGSLMAKVYAPLFFYRNKKAVQKCLNVVYVTSNFLQSRYPTEYKSYGVSDVIVNCNSEYHKIRKTLKNNLINVGLIGSLDSPHKGISDAINAIRLLVDKGYKIQLNILGPGDKNKWLKNCYHVKDNINFIGVINGSQLVQDWLSKQDIYIQPSLQEGLPRAVIEAMNCGLPVVGSNAGGLPELLHREYIHKKHDYHTLAVLIEKVMHPSEYEKLSRYSIEKSEQYDFSLLHTKRIKIWEEILLE